MITSRGKRWELLHSLWIGWTFTLGFFNWIAFLYIGVRARRKQWIFWGIFYSVPFVLAMALPSLESWLGDVVIFLTFALGVAGIVHAFRVRKDYLVRLEMLQEDTINKAPIERRADAKYEVNSKIYEDLNAKKTLDRPSTDGLNVTKDTSASSQPDGNSFDLSPQSTETGQVSNESARSSASSNRLATSTKVSGELEYRISSSYPFPLAFGYRSLASIVDPRDLYREQLRVAENLLAFLGAVSLSVLREEDRKKSGIDPREFWRSGISPGDWKEIVRLCSKAFASYENTPVASAIKDLNIRSEKKGFGANIFALIRAKNDYKHDRGPVVLDDIFRASEEVQENLRGCMESLAFFTEYPIRQVEDFDVKRGGSGVILKCLRYTGDHPSFPQEEVAFDTPLPRGDLFLDSGGTSWVPLFPFMISMTCSHCKVRETYFIDMWDTRKNIVSMKSFERGHTASNMEIPEALAEWIDNSEL